MFLNLKDEYKVILFAYEITIYIF